MDYNKEYDFYLKYFEEELSKFIKGLDKDTAILSDSIEYAIVGGGKRVRPVLMLATAKMLGVDFERVKYYALSLEMIHSYSLVHDDLPAMDNDDYRRGKLSTHKKFGEAYGILAGDALLNLAYETMLINCKITSEDIEAMKIVSTYSGYLGMIKGQVLDMQGEQKNDNDEKFLYDIYYNKTARLITIPLLVASIIAGKKYYDELQNLGYHLGILFQITDDILDEESDLTKLGKTPHKDKDQNKYTSIRIFGLKGAKERAKYHYEKCIDILSGIKGSEFLINLTESMYNRKN